MLHTASMHNMEDCFRHGLPPGSRRIAWDGLSFCVPQNWELATYQFQRRGVTRIELEDDYTVRVEAEWVRSRKRLELERIMKRYEDASKPLTLRSDERNAIGDLPQNWHATHFVFKETGADKGNPDLHVIRHELVTAFYLCPRSSVFCFFILHMLPEDREDPIATIRQIASTFQDHDGAETVPWQLFDIAFRLPGAFTLESAQFDIGAKRMNFAWRGRRLFLWHFSCAGMFLTDDVTPATWAAGYLNGFGGLHGPQFMPDGRGGIAWRRRRPYLFGHRTEIARRCFRYTVGFRRIASTDQLVVWVYQYRRADDLRMLPS